MSPGPRSREPSPSEPARLTREQSALPCGTDRVELLAQVADGRGHDRTTHQQDCPYCAPVLEQYQRLWAPVDEMAAETVRAPRGLFAQALSWVRTLADDPRQRLMSLGDDLPEHHGAGPHTPPPVGGQSHLAARVMVRCARLAAEEVTGVRLALAGLSFPPGPLVDVEPPEAATIATTVVADYGLDLHELADRIRTRVSDRILTLTGARPRSISVHVDDVLG